MKRLFILFALLILSSFIYAADTNTVVSNYSADKSLYAVVVQNKDINSVNVFTEIPPAPEGYHLISIETYFIYEGKDNIKRVYLFTNNSEIKGFSVTSAIQTSM